RSMAMSFASNPDGRRNFIKRSPHPGREGPVLAACTSCFAAKVGKRRATLAGVKNHGVVGARFTRAVRDQTLAANSVRRPALAREKFGAAIERGQHLVGTGRLQVEYDTGDAGVAIAREEIGVLGHA